MNEYRQAEISQTIFHIVFVIQLPQVAGGCFAGFQVYLIVIAKEGFALKQDKMLTVERPILYHLWNNGDRPDWGYFIVPVIWFITPVVISYFFCVEGVGWLLSRSSFLLQGGKWLSYHVDDLHQEAIQMPSLQKLKTTSVSGLFEHAMHNTGLEQHDITEVLNDAEATGVMDTDELRGNVADVMSKDSTTEPDRESSLHKDEDTATTLGKQVTHPATSNISSTCIRIVSHPQ